MINAMHMQAPPSADGLSTAWRVPATAAAQPQVQVRIGSFDELQQHVSAAKGPTTFVVTATQKLLPAKRTLILKQPGIIITSSTAYLQHGKAQLPKAPSIAVDCSRVANGSSLLHIRAPGVQLHGFHIQGCKQLTIIVDLDSSSSSSSVVLGHLELKGHSDAKHAGSAVRIGGGSVVLQSSAITSSSSAYGGALHAVNSRLWVDSCSFDGNGG